MNSTRNIALNEQQLRMYAPSIFSETSAARVSDKYKHISTIEVLRGLEQEGFFPVKAMQSRSRSLDKREHTKHMIRFRHVDAQANDDGLFQELVLVNSHDGLSSYKLMAGLYRLVCSNGLIAGNTFKQIRVKHQGDIVGNVIEGTYEVMQESKLLLDSSANMSSIELSNDEKKIFAEAVHELRFDGKSIEESGIKPDQLLRPRRYQENGKSDLFTVFNVAQENAIKGGLTGYAIDPNGRYTDRTNGNRLKKVSTREIKSIDQSNSLNVALWTLAEKMAELKRS